MWLLFLGLCKVALSHSNNRMMINKHFSLFSGYKMFTVPVNIILLKINTSSEITFRRVSLGTHMKLCLRKTINHSYQPKTVLWVKNLAVFPISEIFKTVLWSHGMNHHNLENLTSQWSVPITRLNILYCSQCL